MIVDPIAFGLVARCTSWREHLFPSWLGAKEIMEDTKECFLSSFSSFLPVFLCSLMIFS
jgi:hypothetical protein